MNNTLQAHVPLEPERYELRAAAPYRFDLDRRDLFKFWEPVSLSLLC